MAKQHSLPINDPENYRELSKPFESMEECADQFEQFFAGVGELRKKHHIADAYVIVAFTVTDADGNEGQRFGSFQFGNQLMAEGMTAWAFGREQEARAALVARALKQGKGFGEKDDGTKVNRKQ